MKEFAFMGNLELRYSTINAGDLMASLPAVYHKNAERILNKAKSRTHVQVLEKLTDLFASKIIQQT